MPRLCVQSVLAFFSVLVLSSCEPGKALETLTNEAEQQRAFELIETMRRNDAQALMKVFDPQLANDGLPPAVEQMSKLLPKGEPDERKLVGVQFNSTVDQRTATLNYQYRFGESYFLVTVVTRDDLKEKTYRVLGMHVNSLERPAGEAPAFDLAGKSATQYAVLLGGLIALAITLVALVMCIFHRGLPKKWLWILAILLGVTQFSVDWSTGAWVFKPVHWQLFSFGAYAPAYGNWVIFAALPVGAIAYLILRRRWNSERPPVSKDHSQEPERTP